MHIKSVTHLENIVPAVFATQINSDIRSVKTWRAKFVAKLRAATETWKAVGFLDAVSNSPATSSWFCRYLYS